MCYAAKFSRIIENHKLLSPADKAWLAPMVRDIESELAKSQKSVEFWTSMDKKAREVLKEYTAISFSPHDSIIEVIRKLGDLIPRERSFKPIPGTGGGFEPKVSNCIFGMQCSHSSDTGK